MLRVGFAFVALPSTLLHLGCTGRQEPPSRSAERSAGGNPANNNEKPEPTKIAKGNSMQVQYLEIVTPDVEAVCQTYSKLHGIKFNDADQNLGGARTAKLSGGGMIGIRAPMRDTETPVVRPYILVNDIQAAVDAAAESGAEIAIPPMEIPGHGKFAIFIQGGIESGLWQI
jgi:predicted enzyme related to lactoylglutathione lyase